MDADTSPARRPSPAPGGTVEPANRASVAKERFQTPNDPPGAHYELRDPFAEVTYRSDRFEDMVAKADQLGSSRFVAVDADGQRTIVQKVDGAWPPGPQHAVPERGADAGPRDRGLDAAQDRPGPQAPAPTALTAPAPARDPTPPTPPDPIAQIDAQAERAARVAWLEAALAERYVIKRAPVTVGDLTIGRTEYRFRGDAGRVAFTESTFRLATDTNSPSVARSMVDVAEARHWRGLRVSGNDDFRRLVWLEATVRGVKTLGYEPNPADLERLQQERDARQRNRIEPARVETPGGAGEKASGRGGGRKAVLAAIEAVLVAQGVPAPRREAVMAAATEKLAQRVREGQAPKVRVYDPAAPSQRTVAAPTPEVRRTRERTPPAPTR